ncbi:tetratricopeptide repeat-containing diguanylate cyclase [Pseudoalteromonas distincta]|uniref:tetratricopeptide repeat-containing diguanylate cyclase n=1 Tax=Pseudoalteromonas distincta TaxID=77608 RepID=UPI00241E8D03|nr:GGDEF domain-containing protein [Pseudoalteromonas distincta]|tara:strand:+ start:10720 stop:12639 length:1920 start_codon:yes stop_codon:yes gene_type:complete
MANNTQIKILGNALWAKYIVLLLFLLFSKLASANGDSLNATSHALDFDTTQTLINNIKLNELDYLQNGDKLTQAFKISKDQNWEKLHLEAAALYAELLFRQEKYAALNTHLSYYLKNKELPNQKSVYLLFLESQLKSLARDANPAPAHTLATKLEESLQQHSSKEKIIILRALAYYYTDTDALKKTLNVALEGLELALKDDDSASQGYFFRKIADAYNYLNEKDKAVYYAKKAVEAYEQTQDGLFTAKAYWSLGNILLEINKPKDALIYLDKALLYFKKANMQKGLTFAQYSIASIEYLQANYDKALTLTKENIELARSAGVHDMQLASLILLADIYIKLDLLDQANEANDEVFLKLDKFSRSIYKADFLSKRYELKRRLNYTNEAFEAIEQKLFYTKKHYEATSESNIKTLQVQFEVKEKEEKIQQLEYAKDISELQAKEEYQQKIIWRLSAAIAFILVIASLFLFYRQAQQRQKYHDISLTDYLTNSPNRRGIMRAAEAKLDEGKMTIAIVDLDYFKKVNDQFGHDVGDLVLISFAKAAKETLSGDHQFGRYGGEEWLFALNSVDELAIRDIFDQLATRFTEHCSNIKDLPSDTKITFSVGASVSSPLKSTLDVLIKHADKLLYKAKENGRNQVVVD